MLPEIYKEFSNFILTTKNDAFKILNVLKDNPDAELYSSYQEYIIGFGTVLENQYGFEGSKIITEIETHCEDIYNALCSTNYEESYQKLVDGFTNIINDIGKTVVEKDTHTAIVLIAKDENRDIKEWLEYHLIVGIEHFYIYDNGSHESFKKILDSYIEKGIVTYHWFPGELKQLEAYNHAIEHYKKDVRYMAFIDADEFLVSMEDKKIPQVIDAIIDKYENGKYKISGHAGGIGINWRNYGTSGNIESADELVIKSHIMRTFDDNEINVHIKTIANPRVLRGFSNTPHAPEYEKGYYSISENGSYIPSAFFFDSKCELIRINHYYMKSEKEYFEKVRRGWPIWKHEEKSEEWIRNQYEIRLEEYNKVEDDILVKYADEVERRINTEMN